MLVPILVLLIANFLILVPVFLRLNSTELASTLLGLALLDVIIIIIIIVSLGA